MLSRRTTLVALGALLLASCGSTPPPPPAPVVVQAPPAPPKKIKIGLALGGGAARGFAHIGVIKALEAQGIHPEIVASSMSIAIFCSAKPV